MVIFFPLPSRTAVQTTAAPWTLGVPTVVPWSVDTISTSVSSTVAPGSTESFSTLTTSPGETRSCFPPVRTTAYIGHCPPCGSIRTNHYRERGFACQLRKSPRANRPRRGTTGSRRRYTTSNRDVREWRGGGGHRGGRRHRRGGAGRNPPRAPLPGARDPAPAPRAGEGRTGVARHAPRNGSSLPRGPRHRLDLPDAGEADLVPPRRAEALSDPRGFPVLCGGLRARSARRGHRAHRSRRRSTNAGGVRRRVERGRRDPLPVPRDRHGKRLRALLSGGPGDRREPARAAFGRLPQLHGLRPEEGARDRWREFRRGALHRARRDRAYDDVHPWPVALLQRIGGAGSHPRLVGERPEGAVPLRDPLPARGGPGRLPVGRGGGILFGGEGVVRLDRVRHGVSTPMDSRRGRHDRRRGEGVSPHLVGRGVERIGPLLLRIARNVQPPLRLHPRLPQLRRKSILGHRRPALAIRLRTTTCIRNPLNDGCTTTHSVRTGRNPLSTGR